MPRSPRELYPDGIYHVILRGVNKLNIFAENDEKQYFLQVLTRMGSQNEYELYAYCLMINHAHLLVKPLKLSLPDSMKRINISYVHYYNKKYERTGPLLDDRYKSVIIKDDTQFIVCARYIHNNPVKAGITGSAGEYPWSSFRYYLGTEYNFHLPLNRSKLLGIFDVNERKAIELLNEFTALNSEENEEGKDATVEKIIVRLLSDEGLKLSDINRISPEVRNRIIRAVKKQTGATAAVLSRLLGISQDIIYKAGKISN